MGSRHCGRWVVAAALFAALGTSLSGVPSAKGERPSAPNAAVRAAPGEIIVGFKRGLSSRRRADALDRARAAPAARLPEIGAVLATVPAGEVRAALAKLRGERGVRYAEANFTLYASGHGAS